MSMHFHLPLASPLPWPPANRRAIEDQIELLIALLDATDGDPDLEDDDPAGGNVEDEPQAAEGQDYYRLLPIYGVDQTLGPLNEIEAERQRCWDMGCRP